MPRFLQKAGHDKLIFLYMAKQPSVTAKQPKQAVVTSDS